MRAVMVVAAAAVVWAAALLAVPASPRPAAAMPRFYVVVAGLQAVVRASADGHVTGTAAIPVAPAGGRTFLEGEVFGGSDGLHFVIVMSHFGDLPGVAGVTLFRLTVAPDGRPERLSQVPFNNQEMPVTGVALSPDDRMLAVSMVHEFPFPSPSGSVQVINVSSGKTRSWASPRAAGYWPGVPAWAGDHTVEVPWWRSTTSLSTFPAVVTGIRRIDTAAPGSLAAPLTAFPAPVPGLESAVITPGDVAVVASSCRAAGDTATGQIVELSAANGQLIRVLQTQTARFSTGNDAAGAAFSSCRVLSVAGEGDDVLVQDPAFGRIDHGVFTALPGASSRAEAAFAAW
jgi:hypothetical protein